MPIYEYQCDACGHQLEKLQKLNDDPLVNCPSCSKDELRKMISAAGFRLKGGGWYETDFKTGNKKNLVGNNKSSDNAAKTNSSKTAQKSGSTNTAASSSKST